MGHYVVYLTQSLDARLRELKAKEVAASTGRSPEQVHHLLQQAPGKVTHPTSLEMAEHIKHIFKQAGLLTEIREVEESFAEHKEEKTNNDAALAEQHVADALPMLETSYSDNVFSAIEAGGAAGEEAMKGAGASGVDVTVSDESDEGAKAATEAAPIPEVSMKAQQHQHERLRPWLGRLRALSVLLLLLLCLVLLLWWRNNQQSAFMLTANPEQHMRQLVAHTKAQLHHNPTLSSQQLVERLESFNKLNSDFLALYAGANIASSYWQDNALSSNDSSSLEARIIEQVEDLSESNPIIYRFSTIDDGRAVLWAQRFQSNYHNYDVVGVFRAGPWSAMQQHSNMVMLLIIVVIVASLLLTLALRHALRS